MKRYLRSLWLVMNRDPSFQVGGDAAMIEEVSVQSPIKYRKELEHKWR